jgi:hypothetical protein
MRRRPDPPAYASGTELLALSSLDPAEQSLSRLWERSAGAASPMTRFADAVA